MKWIAVRSLTTDKASGSRKIEVSIGTPEKMGPDKWRCPTRVLIAGIGEVFYVPSVEAFGSLINAFLYIRRRLEDLHCEFFWLSEANKFHSGHGFPYFLLPQLFGVEFNKKVERLVKKETKKQIKKMMNMTKAEKFAN